MSRLAPAVGAGGGIGEEQTEGVMDQRSGLGSYAHGAFGVDYEARIDFAALREQRLERARGALAASPLDALLLWKDENVRFLSGLRPQIIQGKSALLNGCLLAGDGSLVLFCSGGEVDRVRSVMPWVESVETVPIMEARGLIAGTVAEVIAPVLERHGLAAAAIGLDELAYAQVEELSRVLPEAELADGDAVMQSVRLIKSDARAGRDAGGVRDRRGRHGVRDRGRGAGRARVRRASPRRCTPCTGSAARWRISRPRSSPPAST